MKPEPPVSAEKEAFPYLVSDRLEHGLELLEAARFSEAGWVLRGALRRRPGDRRALEALARCSVAMGDERAAASYAARAGEGVDAVTLRSPAVGEPVPGGIFVGGTGRSGTSLLRRLLNTHPDIASIPGETKCINDATFRLAPHWFAARAHADRARGIEALKDAWRERFFCYMQPRKASPTDDRRRGFCLWLDPADLERELPRLDLLRDVTGLHDVEQAWGGLYAALFDLRPAAAGKRLWVEKTPNNARFADHLYTLLPDMRLVNIVRDGRDVAASMQNVPWGEKDHCKALDWWAREAVAAARVLDSLPGHVHLTVRYEDLAADPGAVMGHICDFLGIASGGGMEVFDASVGRWKQALPGDVQRHAAERHGELLASMGYDPEPGTGGVSVPAAVGFEMKKRDDGVRYMADLVLPLQRSLACVPMRAVTAETGPCFFLRHDVDDDLDAAMRMALLEKENGLRATYFLLPPSPSHGGANYYGEIKDKTVVPHARVVDESLRLLEWGHDVGLHNNLAELAVQSGRDVADVLREQLDFFASHGIPIHGTSAHGSPFFHDNDFISFEIFAEAGVKPERERGRIVRIGGRELRLHTLRMADFGLFYEAYSLPYDIGINDSNRRWGGGLVNRSAHPDLNDLRGAERMTAFREIVEGAAPERGVSILQVLVHPEHWEQS